VSTGVRRDGARRGPAQAGEWHVRRAREADATAVAAAVAELLVELGGTAPDAHAMRSAAASAIADEQRGIVLVAQAGDGQLVGVLAVSWPLAIHAAGRYALIQDLWVRESWRSNSVGAALLAELNARVRAEGIERVEVGLPRESFSGLAATSAFYRQNGFEQVGPRMRRSVA